MSAENTAENNSTSSRRQFLKGIAIGTGLSGGVTVGFSNHVNLGYLPRPLPNPGSPTYDIEVIQTGETEYTVEPHGDTYTLPDSVDDLEQDDLLSSNGVWGANYSQTDAYNWWQIWGKDDEMQEFEREFDQDMEYAEAVNQNAIRLFCSYEYWQENPEEHDKRVDSALQIADDHNIQPMLVFFESLGENPTQENVRDPDISSSHAVQSPSNWEVYAHNDGFIGGIASWGRSRRYGRPSELSPEDYTRHMAETFGGRDEVLALEIMNEPLYKPVEPLDFYHEFADDMLGVARKVDPDAPLTMGSRLVEFNTDYSYDLDVYQYHHNFPNTEEEFIQGLHEAKAFMDEHTDGDTELWLTEWQRVMDVPYPAEKHPDNYQDYPTDALPHYESLAPIVQQTDVVDGAFFWGEKVKPAYLPWKRKDGIVNGLFFDDGSVWSQEGASWIAGESVDLPEQQNVPDGMDQFL